MNTVLLRWSEGAIASPALKTSGGTWSGTAVTGNIFDPASAGSGMHAIMYTYTDANGCARSAVDSIWVDVCNGLTPNATTDGFDVYPNPNNGTFTLQLNTKEIVDVMIYDAIGQLVSAMKAQPDGQQSITLHAPGVYLVVVVAADGSRTMQRVSVNQ